MAIFFKSPWATKFYGNKLPAVHAIHANKQHASGLAHGASRHVPLKGKNTSTPQTFRRHCKKRFRRKAVKSANVNCRNCGQLHNEQLISYVTETDVTLVIDVITLRQLIVIMYITIRSRRWGRKWWLFSILNWRLCTQPM